MTTLAVVTINEISATWAPLVWKASWQGGIALLLILVVSRALRKIPARVRCWLWRLAFFKLLIAGLWINPVELSWLPPVTTMVSENPPPTIESAADEFPAQFDVAPTSLRPPHGRPSAIPKAIPELSRLSVLLIAWIVGVILFLANLARHWAQVRKMTSSLETVTDKQVLDSVVENCRQMGVSRQPQLRVSNSSGGPCLIGIVRPVIVLPSVIFKACSADELNAALIHELAHIKRRDLLWNWLPALAEAVFFFHPLVWLAKREWRLAQEIATDELAVSVSRVNLARYAKSLVELAAKCPTVTICPHLAIAVSEAYHQLSRRMIAMQTFQELTARRRLAMAIVVLAIAVFGVVPWKLTPREAQAQSESVVASEEQAIQADTPQDNRELSTRTITIRVVDPKGEPMKGVRVFRNHVYKLEGGERPRIENKNYWTDSDGKAVVSLSGTSVDLRLWATKKNFVPLHAMWAKQFQSDGDEIPDEFTFQLQQGTTIGGIVKNEQGKPIEGVKVEVLDRAAEQMHVASNTEPGKRPVISQWLAEDESAVYTDARGRWMLGNVPPDKSLVFDKDRGDRLFDDDIANRFPLTRFLLRLSHPKYVDDSKRGGLQSEQGIADESLRSQTATIVMKRDAEAEPGR